MFLKKDMFNLLSHTINHNQSLQISTDEGNTVLLSEEDYNALIETLYLSNTQKKRERS